MSKFYSGPTLESHHMIGYHDGVEFNSAEGISVFDVMYIAQLSYDPLNAIDRARLVHTHLRALDDYYEGFVENEPYSTSEQWCAYMNGFASGVLAEWRREEPLIVAGIEKQVGVSWHQQEVVDHQSSASLAGQEHGSHFMKCVLSPDDYESLLEMAVESDDIEFLLGEYDMLEFEDEALSAFNNPFGRPAFSAGVVASVMAECKARGL